MCGIGLCSILLLAATASCCVVFSTAAVVGGGRANKTVGHNKHIGHKNTTKTGVAPPPSRVAEPGQNEYRAELRDSIYNAIDFLLYEPLPDSDATVEYRNGVKIRDGISELAFGVLEAMRDEMPDIDKQQMYKSIDQGADQFSEVVYKTIAAVNAAEVALAAPAAGIRAALERRGYVFTTQNLTDPSYRGLFGDGGDGGKNSIWPVLQTAGNILDLTKCVKDSLTGHFDHVNVFEVIPVAGPMMTKMPFASVFLDMFDKQVKPFKRFIYAASCVKELADTHWGPNEPPPTDGNAPAGIANAMCAALQSGDDLMGGAMSMASGVAQSGLGMASSLADNTIGAVPLVGDRIVDFKHSAADKVASIMQGGMSAGSAMVSGVGSVAGGAQKAARGALSAVWYG